MSSCLCIHFGRVLSQKKKKITGKNRMLPFKNRIVPTSEMESLLFFLNFLLLFALSQLQFPNNSQIAQNWTLSKRILRKKIDLSNFLDFDDDSRYDFARCEGCDGSLLGHLEVKCCGKEGFRYGVKQYEGFRTGWRV